jgi:hypothetical protein
MRKFLIAALLVSAGAITALAQEQKNWAHHHQRSDYA